MNYIEFKEYTEKLFRLNNLDAPTEEQVKKLFKLTEHMLKVNETMNLTAITEPKAVILKHYIDSLLCMPYIPNNTKVIDVGCGAGFPTLPLAIFRSDLTITALDATAKRIKYVEETAKLLCLDNVLAISARAEELAKDKKYREKFDIATARAVANLPVLAELCLPFVKENGSFVAMKASQGKSELSAAESAIKLCGGAIEKEAALSLVSESLEHEQRFIASIKKISTTPSKYPRHYSQISKKPL